MFNPSFSYLDMWNEIILTVLMSLSTTLGSESFFMSVSIDFSPHCEFYFPDFFLHDGSFL